MKDAIENVGNSFILAPEQAVESLDAINSESVGCRIHVKDFSARPYRPGSQGERVSQTA